LNNKQQNGQRQTTGERKDGHEFVLNSDFAPKETKINFRFLFLKIHLRFILSGGLGAMAQVLA
jgi:hypothetical protein